VPLAFGIDIGGTKVAIGLVDDSGQVRCHLRVATTGPEDTVREIVSACRDIAGPVFGEVSAVGVGASGPLDLVAGSFAITDNLPGWAGTPIVAVLQKALGLPVALENDADAALVGELFHGAGRANRGDVVAMLTFGTGVGGAIWTGSGLFRGAYGEHPEIGHMPVLSDGPACYCGARGCLEAEASGTALTAAFGDPRRLFEAETEDEKSAGILRRMDRALKAAVINLAHTFRPALIVFGGGVMEAHYGRFAQRLEMAATSSTQLLQPMQVAKAELGNQAGMIGAAAIALRREKGT
jgi:predicted NBD/HSP70 family sugar kinase